MSNPIARLAVLLPLFFVVSCQRIGDSASTDRSPSTLTVGFGLPTDESSAAGIVDTVRSIALERLVVFTSDGRPRARLAERWDVSADGLTLRLSVRSGALFHNGQAVTAAAVRDALVRFLPTQLGPAFADVRDIRATGDHEVVITLHRPSSFVFEGLEITVQQAAENERPIGTGPFYVTDRDDGVVEMRANERYYAGKPGIDRILFRSYDSVRAAWAEMLRGQVDMLFEVGQDALESMRPSTQTKIFTVDRPYAYLVLFNLRRPILRDQALRRALNAAIDRQALVDQMLNGHGTPADSPLWPKHWAHSAELPNFRYDPHPVRPDSNRLRLSCLVGDPSTERVALFVQRQLQAVGVDLELESLPLQQAVDKFASGTVDAFLVDAAHGPTMLRPYLLWRTGAPINLGGFSSKEVDAALDAVRDASADDEDKYRAGVAAFQRAILNDPPAIFLAWSQRARAVSTKFEVPVELGGDIISNLRLWRPANVRQVASRN